MKIVSRIIIVFAALTVSASCVSMDSIRPGDMNILQIVSAGHTGCATKENEITNVDFDRADDGTWNANC